MLERSNIVDGKVNTRSKQIHKFIALPNLISRGAYPNLTAGLQQHILLNFLLNSNLIPTKLSMRQIFKPKATMILQSL